MPYLCTPKLSHWRGSPQKSVYDYVHVHVNVDIDVYVDGLFKISSGGSLVPLHEAITIAAVSLQEPGISKKIS
jgi:hypothetical protein